MQPTRMIQSAFAVVILLLLVAPLALSHGMEEEAHEGTEHMASEPTSYLPIDPFMLALYDFALIVLLIAITLLFPQVMTAAVKKAFFIIIALPVVLITLYLGGATVYLNLISESGGPAHWHADFEVWACGEKITNLPRSKLPANYVGTASFHYHDDFRLHVEGLVVKKTDVDLGSFFKVIGGSMGKSSISIPIEGGEHLEYRNGDLCPDGKPGKLKLYIMDWQTAEFKENALLDEFVLAPHFNVPRLGETCYVNCGDYMKIAFETE